MWGICEYLSTITFHFCLDVNLCHGSESAATLEAESGYTMETPDVSRFRQCILDGDWDSAEDTLMRLGLSEEEGLWVSGLTSLSSSVPIMVL